ncbi:MAG: YfhO family protein [Firmicutes bacterium]|nr:YfhO family protein [Bacillota bacterium]
MKRLYIYAGLTSFVLVLAFIPMGSDRFFGSEGDWISQHVGAAENLRQMILSTGTLFPQYSAAGGGCNIYDYAYYGLYRPDVLISCLFPDISMKYFIAGYALLSMTLSVNLCYAWLNQTRLKSTYAGLASMLMACASCFFHAHHQIVFVNYMPFLILTLIGIDKLIEKKKIGLMVFGLTMICFHSFYYAPCSYIVALLYGVYALGDAEITEKKSLLLRGTAAAGLSIGISGILLIPTAMNILSTEKDAGAFMNEGLGIIDPALEGLLFTPYGCGLTLLSFICLIAAFVQKSKRFLAGAILFVMAVPAVPWILNGFLYARGKILIPFLPLVVWLCGDVLEWLEEVLHQKGFDEIWMNRCLPVLLVVPIITSLVVNQNEDYLPVNDQRQTRFSLEEIDAIVKDKRYRFDYLSNPFVNCNLTAGNGIYKTAMYSSINNAEYSKFYYDTMKNPICLRNRVVLIPGQNPLFNYFMGIRYIQCVTEQLPKGYQIIKERKGFALAENQNVLPVAYGTSQTLSEAEYAELEFPENMEALCRYTVTADGQQRDFDSHLEAADFQSIFSGSIEAGENMLPCKKSMKDKILFIAFDVEDRKGNGVDISINGVKNHLSAKTAPYPNGNYRFTYVFTTGEEMNALEIEASQGEWNVENIDLFFMDKDAWGHNEIYEIEEIEKPSGTTMLSGKVDMKEEGYFVTSFPYRRGYRIYVDGKRRSFEKVNTAFVGFPLERGLHQVEICYIAQGFVLGSSVTALSLLCVLIRLFWRKRRKR